MNTKTVYIFHKNGAKSHYLGMEHLLKNNGIKLVHYEFSIISKLFKSIVKGRPKLFIRQLHNSFFLLRLLSSKNKKIVLGIAPFDCKLKRLLRVLNKHNVYYHTSWTYWDKSFHPKKAKNSDAYEVWRFFLEEKAKHIFAVSNKTKNSILANYQVDKNKISVVNHSLDPTYEQRTIVDKIEKSFIYVGRLLPEKGIDELLSVFARQTELKLSIVGSGKLEGKAAEYANSYANIKFYGYMDNKQELITLIAKHRYLVLNSKRTEKWEELFGMVIIEAMSQGTVPIASMHSGPKEIITQDTGYLYPEGDLENTLLKISESNKTTFSFLSKNCIVFSSDFTLEKIAQRWQPILR